MYAKTLQYRDTVKLSMGGNAVQFREKSVNLLLHTLPVGIRISSIGRSDTQLVRALEHGMDLLHSAFGSVYQANSIQNIAFRLVKSFDAGPHTFGDCQPCGVISRTVDLIAGRKPL